MGKLNTNNNNKKHDPAGYSHSWPNTATKVRDTATVCEILPQYKKTIRRDEATVGKTQPQKAGTQPMLVERLLIYGCSWHNTNTKTTQIMLVYMRYY